jgi:hypothetical protein
MLILVKIRWDLELNFNFFIVSARTQAGKLESVYGFVEGRGTAVLNVESAEELNELLLSVPITAFGTLECRVLADIEAVALNLTR